MKHIYVSIKNLIQIVKMINVFITSQKRFQPVDILSFILSLQFITTYLAAWFSTALDC